MHTADVPILHVSFTIAAKVFAVDTLATLSDDGDWLALAH